MGVGNDEPKIMTELNQGLAGLHDLNAVGGIGRDARSGNGNDLHAYRFLKLMPDKKLNREVRQARKERFLNFAVNFAWIGCTTRH
jgi:hypothetical protein